MAPELVISSAFRNAQKPDESAVAEWFADFPEDIRQSQIDGFMKSFDDRRYFDVNPRTLFMIPATAVRWLLPTYLLLACREPETFDESKLMSIDAVLDFLSFQYEDDGAWLDILDAGRALTMDVNSKQWHNDALRTFTPQDRIAISLTLQELSKRNDELGELAQNLLQVEWAQYLVSS